MQLSELLRIPCTIIPRSESDDQVDGYGNAQVVEGTPRETLCELQQEARAEPAGEGELSVTRWLAVLPAGTELDTSDVLVIAGHRYELIGDPEHVSSLWSGEEDHVEATLKRTGPEVGS